MKSTKLERNLRVIVIDDIQSIHADFRKILTGGNGRGKSNAMEKALFGQAVETHGTVAFKVDSAYQGLEGFEMVKRALQDGVAYSVAFIDMRMPPGWDGIETAERIWAIDPDLQVVICTAYSDYSWNEMIERLGPSDKLLILKKPFDNTEVLQLATALSEKWHLSRQARFQMENLEKLVEERTSKLTAANSALTEAIANVKELSGLMPICSYCKKVRHDHDYWQSVEQYITDHTNARFTHGICPACLESKLRDIDRM
jgi:two-component system, NtrC family, sensor kinase